MIPVAEYIFGLKFEEKPDYNRIRFHFTKNLLDKEMIPNNLYDWNRFAYRGIQSEIQESQNNDSSNHLNEGSFNLAQLNQALQKAISEESFDMDRNVADEFQPFLLSHEESKEYPQIENG